jgi:adenylate kinase family enzyme
VEREIALIAGLPGNGKNTLGDNLVTALASRRTVDHIAAGDVVRSIADYTTASPHADRITDHLNSPRALLPLPDAIIGDVIRSELEMRPDVSLTFLNGFPRRKSQVDIIYHLAKACERTLLGVIIVHTDDSEVVIERLMKRPPDTHGPVLTREMAVGRLNQHKRLLDEMLFELACRKMKMEFVDTAQSKEEATSAGLDALDRLLN